MANTKDDQLSDEGLRKSTGISADDEAKIDSQARSNRYRDAWANSRAAASPKHAAHHARYGNNLRLQERNASPAANRGAAQADAAEPPSSSNAQLAAQEERAADDTNYTGSGTQEDGGGKKKKRKSTIKALALTKRRVGIAGAITGSIVSIVTFCLTFVSGTFEFLHVSQILHDAHFSSMETVGDGRMGKMYRFLRKGGSVGETRLGFVASKYHDQMIKKLNNIGISPDYGPFDTYQGFSVDTEHENSPYKDMTPEEAAAAFEEKTGFKPDIVDGKLRVNARNFWSQGSTIKAALSLTGDSKITVALGARVMSKFGLVSRWHPLQALAKNKVVNITNYFTEKWNGKNGVLSNDSGPPVSVDGSTATDGTDKDGNPIPASAEEQTAASKAASTPGTSSEVLKGIVGGKVLSTADGIANIAGVACALKAVNDNVAKIRYLSVIVPLTKMGMETIIIGDQIKSGQDVDQRELQYLAKNFASAAAAGAALTWYDNAQIRAAAHDVGGVGGRGVDSLAKNGLKDLITQNSLSWLAWTQGLGAICSTPAQIATGVVGIGIGVLSGGVASTVAGLAVGQLSQPLIDKATDLLAGQAVNTKVGASAGPVWGGEVDEGAALGANATALAMGGAALTPAQTTQLTAMTDQEQRDDFHAKSLYAQMFDPGDYRSLASQLADSTGGSPLIAANKLFGTMLNSSSRLLSLSLPFNLYTSMASADAPSTYDYGFPMYGFSLQDQTNSLVENPYDNADKAAAILDNNNQSGTPDYIKKAEDCFGVNITKGAEGWDVIPEKDVNIYDSRNYNPADCAGPQVASTGKVITASKITTAPADPNTGIMAQTASTPLSSSQAADWLRIRFFILDTRVMDGYACANFNDTQSCADDGMGDPNSATANPTTAYPAALAAQILADSDIDLSASAKADLQATSLGQRVTPGPTSSTNPCANNTPVTLDPNLLQGIINISQEYSFTIDSLVSGHACDNGRHPLGRAMDITQINKTPITWSGANLAQDKEFATNVASIMYGLMPNGSIQNGQPINMPGIGVCHQDDISPPPSGVNYFVDPSCNKLSVDVGVAGAP